VLALSFVSFIFAAWLLELGRHQWFVTDEWDYLSTQGEPLLGWLFRPHNEHTIVFTKLWFQALVATIGVRHYAVYLIPLVAAHLVVVGASYRLTWLATTSRIVATGVALPVLAMGAAAGTLTWAGQFQYVGSVAAGMLAILLSVERRKAWWLPVLIVVTAFGTLNGSAFIAFGIAAGVVLAHRREWAAAGLVALIPVVWQVVVRVVWQPVNPFAAEDLHQILRSGPAFAYSILDVAVSQTVGDNHLTSAILVVVTLGTLALLSTDGLRPLTRWSRSIAGALALAPILTMLLLILGRLSRSAILASGGGYSYLFLASLVPLAGILLAHVGRSRVSSVAILTGFATLSLIGVATITDAARDLSTWKTAEERLLLTSAAGIADNLDVFPEQIPVPDTAASLTQAQLRSWITDGRIDAGVAGQTESDQVSLNLQWRVQPTTSTGDECRDVAIGETIDVPRRSAAVLRARVPGSSADLRYVGSPAVRRFSLPSDAVVLESLADRSTSLTVGSGGVQVCLIG
jgi:hypothetical protein